MIAALSVALLAVWVGARTSPTRCLARRTRRRRAEPEDWIATAEAISRGLFAGLTLRQALTAAAGDAAPPVAALLRSILADHRRGLGLAAAADRAASSLVERGAQHLVGAIGLAAATTGAEPQLFDRVADDLEAARALRASAAAHAAQARASAVVVGSLPWVAVGLVAVRGGPIAHALFGTRAGLFCLGGAAALELVGLFWMARLVAGVRP